MSLASRGSERLISLCLERLGRIEIQFDDAGPEADGPSFPSRPAGGKSILAQFGIWGFGLAVLRKDLEAHGGRLALGSGILEGRSPIQITLPLSFKSWAVGGPGARGLEESITLRVLRQLLLESRPVRARVRASLRTAPGAAR